MTENWQGRHLRDGSMPNPDTRTLHPHVPFLYEVAMSFFDMAKDNLEKFLHAIDGYRMLPSHHH